MPDVAAFDFDGTLTTGGSVFDFLTAVAGRAAVARASARSPPAWPMPRWPGGRSPTETKEALFSRVLAGVDADHVDRVAEEFAVRPPGRRVRPEVRRRLDWHRGRGDRVVVVSASPDAYVGGGGRAARRPTGRSPPSSRSTTRDG